jgi:prephenate dehydrogenase
MNICIIGMGLIGGSLSRSLRAKGFAGTIYGVDKNPQHRTIAMYCGLANEFLPLNEAIEKSGLILLCSPVDANLKLLPEILDKIKGTSKVVADMGSTKADLATRVSNHEARGRYVAAHPMAGTEYSGPAAALELLFEEKVAIICDKELCDEDALLLVLAMFQALNMRIQYMNSADHDTHVAYVSHISHITSFALALCVLEKEKDEENILSLAAGGFESTVRLAKSNGDTWAPIFLGNTGSILEVIDTYIEKMNLFKDFIAKGDTHSLKTLMNEANSIRKILK